MRNKKVFFIADANSIHTVKWVDYFVEQNYDVYLATFARKNNTKCKNTYFLGRTESKVSGGNYHYLLGVSRLAKIFRKVQPDIVNAHYSYSMGLIALLAKRRSKIKAEFSVVCHGSDLLAPPKPYLYDKLNRYILNRANKVFVVSDQLKDKVESLNIDIEKVYVGQYGVDISVSDMNKDIDILSNRAYNANSRIDFLLEAIDTMDYRNLNIVFVVPNIGDKDYNVLVNKYPYVTFYKHVEYNKMINLVSRAKIYISATKSDGTSLSLLEAMKLNCIPIVSNIVSNRSWILDGINGYLFNTQRDFLVKVNHVLKSSSNESIIHINKVLMLEKGSYDRQMNNIKDFMIKKL